MSCYRRFAAAAVKIKDVRGVGHHRSQSGFYLARHRIVLRRVLSIPFRLSHSFFKSIEVRVDRLSCRRRRLIVPCVYLGRRWRIISFRIYAGWFSLPSYLQDGRSGIPLYGLEVQQTSVQRQTHLLCPFSFQFSLETIYCFFLLSQNQYPAYSTWTPLDERKRTFLYVKLWIMLVTVIALKYALSVS